MGEYGRTRQRIEDLQEEIKELKQKARTAPTEELKEAYLMEAYEAETELGENIGYLNELANMDGYESYYDYEMEVGW